jgi:hypothetical protein
MSDGPPLSSQSHTFLTDPQHLAGPPESADLDILGDSVQQPGGAILEVAPADEPPDIATEPPDAAAPLGDAPQSPSADAADGMSGKIEGEPRSEEPLLSDALQVATEEFADRLPTDPEADAQSDDHPTDPVLVDGLETAPEQVAAEISDESHEPVLADALVDVSEQIAAEVSEEPASGDQMPTEAAPEGVSDDEDAVDEVPRSRITPTADGEIGILNFQDRYGDNSLPVFTEDETVEAMKRLFIEPKMLVGPKEADFDAMKLPDFPDVRKKVGSMFEKRRRSLINEIINERELVFAERRRGQIASRPGSRVEAQREGQKNAEQTALERIETLQRREVEMLIVAELVREQNAQDDRERQERRERQMQEALAEIKKRQLADKEKRAAKTASLVSRIQERERGLAELQRQQNEEVEKAQLLLAEQKVKRLRDMAEADLERQRRAQAMREELDRRSEEQKRQIMQRQKEQAAHELLLLQRRADKIRELQERNQRIMEEQKAKHALSQQRSLEALEERKRAMQQKEAEVQERYGALIKRRDEAAQSLRDKNQSRVERNQQARTAVAHYRDERMRALAFKDTRDQERRDAIAAKRLERQSQEREMERAKREQIERQKQSRAEEKRKKDEDIERSLEEDRQRLSEVAKRKADDLAKRMAIQRIRDQFRDESADRRANQHRFKREKRGEECQEREAQAIEYVQGVRTLALKKQDHVAALTFKKQDVLHQFRELILRGGRLDIDKLGLRFNIDVDYLREKVSQSRRHPSTETET